MSASDYIHCPKCGKLQPYWEIRHYGCSLCSKERYDAERASATEEALCAHSPRVYLDKIAELEQQLSDCKKARADADNQRITELQAALRHILGSFGVPRSMNLLWTEQYGHLLK